MMFNHASMMTEVLATIDGGPANKTHPVVAGFYPVHTANLYTLSERGDILGENLSEPRVSHAVHAAKTFAPPAPTPPIVRNCLKLFLLRR